MPLPRYKFLDSYTVEELKCRYLASDIEGRISLMRELQYDGLPSHLKDYPGAGTLPHEIALLAAMDPSREVGRWLAQRGHLDQNLNAKLRGDQDPFIRACVLENPTSYSVTSFIWITQDIGLFKDLSPEERLAIMRNPVVRAKIVERVFDLDDTTLNLEIKDRRELALAYLTNIEMRTRDQRLQFSLGEGAADRYRHLEQLWSLASKWPLESGIPYYVYRYAEAEDNTKAKHYRKCEDANLRHAILENCVVTNWKTLELGMKDSDEECRSLAFSIAGKEESLSGRIWAIVKFPLRVFAILVVMALVYLLFHRFTEPFPTAVLSIVILSLLSIWMFYSDWWERTLFEWCVLDRNFRIIGDVLYKEKRSEERRKQEEQIAKTYWKAHHDAEIYTMADGIASLPIIAFILYRLVMALGT